MRLAIITRIEPWRIRELGVPDPPVNVRNTLENLHMETLRAATSSIVFLYAWALIPHLDVRLIAR